jgi:hypothetical protein
MWGYNGVFIYKGSYTISNISYLNLPSPLLSLIPSSPDAWNSFNMYHFAFTYIIYTIFILLPLSPPPQLPPMPTPNHLVRTCSPLLFSDFVEEKNTKDNKKNMVFC